MTILGFPEIRTIILSGRAEDAIALLNQNFPSVLADKDPTTTKPAHSETSGTPKPDSDDHTVMNNLEYISSTSTEPAHLLLNLRILAFSEACRTVPLVYSSETGLSQRETNPMEESMNTDAQIEVDARTSEGQKMALLRKAQKLYALTNMLPDPADRKTYLKELENVSALLVYPVPEESPMAKYLTMERREAVADQINRAILSESNFLSIAMARLVLISVLERTGQPLISALELITRYTTVLWSYAKSNGAKPRPGAILPPKSSAGSTAMDVDSEVYLFSHGIVLAADHLLCRNCLHSTCDNFLTRLHEENNCLDPKVWKRLFGSRETLSH